MLSMRRPVNNQKRRKLKIKKVNFKYLILCVLYCINIKGLSVIYDILALIFMCVCMRYEGCTVGENMM